jgi:hypothetical protein
MFDKKTSYLAVTPEFRGLHYKEQSLTFPIFYHKLIWWLIHKPAKTFG